MPELARFDGIVIVMFTDEHAPPHFHVRYAGVTVSVSISPLELAHGDLPASVWRKVVRWAEGHEAELLAKWRELGGAEARE